MLCYSYYTNIVIAQLFEKRYGTPKHRPLSLAYHFHSCYASGVAGVLAAPPMALLQLMYSAFTNTGHI